MAFDQHEEDEPTPYDLIAFCGDKPIRIPIYVLFDIDGERTDDPFMACTLVGRIAEDSWFATECEPEDLVLRA